MGERVKWQLVDIKAVIMSRKNKPLPQEAVEVQIQSLSHDGRGLTRINDKILFVFGALPGETVKVKYTKVHSRYSEAKTIEILSPSSIRTKPICDHFGVCGGCQLQHLPSTLQIEHKQQFLKEQLEHHAKVTPLHWLPPLQGLVKGYRQKARLGVRYVDKKQSLLIGFREQNNNKIAIIEQCAVLDPRVGNKISALREVIYSLEGKRAIAQIEVAIGTDEVGLVFRHLEPLSLADVTALTAFCEQNQFSLYLQPQGVDSVHKVYPDKTIELTYELSDQGLQYRFHPLDFTQVNQVINQKMVNQALALLAPTKDDVILDLFCGLGNFSLPFAQCAKEVVGVEGTQTMANRAQANAALNSISNARFYAFDLSKAFKNEDWAKKHYTKIVLDPPRCGAQEIVSAIGHFSPKEILYISCNGATFARDAAILVHQHGYQLAKVGVMDMFPHTAHVETIALFNRPQH